MECDCVFQLNLKTTHNASAINTAGDSFSGLQLKTTETIWLKTWGFLLKTAIGMTMSSSKLADGEKFFFTQRDDIIETDDQTHGRIEQP